MISYINIGAYWANIELAAEAAGLDGNGLTSHFLVSTPVFFWLFCGHVRAQTFRLREAHPYHISDDGNCCGSTSGQYRCSDLCVQRRDVQFPMDFY